MAHSFDMPNRYKKGDKMKLVTGLLNEVLLDNVMTAAFHEATRVRASIAYADGKNMRLFDACKNRKIPLEFYGRNDHTVPVAPEVLKWFLDEKSPNLQCKLFRGFFHAKIIWWVESGAYIGSANLTDRAWTTNVEAGIFLTHEELIHAGLDIELDRYFNQVDERSAPLTYELYKEQLDLAKRRKDLELEDEKIRREFEKKALIPIVPNLAAVDRVATETRRFNEFDKEWTATLQIMRDIAALVSVGKVRPHWIRDDVPSSVQADQFLHAYYYLQIRQGNKYPYEDLHLQHATNPEAALQEVMEWWTVSDFDFDAERRHLHEWAPQVRELCMKEKLPTLNKNEFVDLLSRIHAVRDHASKLDASMLGLPPTGATIEDRLEAFGNWLWGQRSDEGKTPLETFYYVVWGRNGHSGEAITRRLWNGHVSKEWGIPHIGLSTLGELVGWARPDLYPPRNGRTSKALKALGYKVRTTL
jgi:HKD family nuclease